MYVFIISRTSFRVNPHSIVCLNVKEPLARSRRHIWSLSDCNVIQTHNPFVRKRTLTAYQVSGYAFKSRYCHLYWVPLAAKCSQYSFYSPCGNRKYHASFQNKSVSPSFKWLPSIFSSWTNQRENKGLLWRGQA